MRANEIVTEAPVGVGYRGKVAGINQRRAAKKAAIDYSNPKVKEKLAKQNYAKWINHVKVRRNQVDLTAPANYKEELLKFFSSNGKVELGNEFKQAVAANSLSKRDLLKLVGLAIDARAAAKAATPPTPPTPADPTPPAAGSTVTYKNQDWTFDGTYWKRQNGVTAGGPKAKEIAAAFLASQGGNS